MNVADKIRKLLALAQSSNPNEAALAASMAQDLMVKHAIEEASLGPVPGSVPEPVESESMGIGGKTVSHWQASLASAMSRAFFCRTYYTPGSDIFMVGRKSDRECFKATWFYLRDEITRMADAGWEKERARSASYLSGARLAGASVKWKRGFCVGAGVTVKERLDSSMKKLAADNAGTAIVLADRQKAVDQAIEKMKLRSSAGRPVNSSGFESGKKAGWALNLDKRAGQSKQLCA